MTIRYQNKLVCCCCANCMQECDKRNIKHELYDCEQYQFSEDRFNNTTKE
jgi:hypothetical protein